MPLDFPNPADTATYTDSTSGNTYTFANGSWSLTSILSATKGGTGFASYNRGDILFGNASGTLSKLGAGTAGSVLSTNGTGADPTWITLSAGGAGTVATPGARYQIAGYYPGTGASVSGSSTFTNDTSSGIVSITHATGSTSPSFGALLVSGGVGIGQSVNIGGRIGVGTNIHIAALNVQTPSASTLGIVIQGSTSQSASLFRVNSSVGGSFFEITNSGIVNIKTSTAGDYNSVPLQRWYGDSDAIVGVMQKGGFFYTGYGLGYVDGAGSQTLVHQWVPNGSYYVTNWSKRMANGTQIMFSSSAGGDVRIYGDTNGSLTFQSYGTYTNNTMVKLLDPNIGTNQALLGVVPQVGGMRSQLYSYGNLSLNMAVAGSAGTDWDTTNLFRANVYTKTKYLGNLAVLAVDDTNRFVVGPYGDTTVSLGGTTVSNALILKGATSQTGNLMEFQSSTGTTYLFINSSGQLGPVTIASTTGSGSTTTGALVVSGGVGIGGSLNVYNLSKFSDHLEIKTQKELRLYNSADSFYTALKAGAVASSSKTFTLPITTGNSGEYLQTDGTGVLTWAAVTSGVSAVNAGVGISLPSTTGSVTVSIGRPVMLNLASGFTPVGIGTDYNILRVPEGKNNTNTNYTIRKVVMGVGATSSGTSTIRVEKSSGPHTGTLGFSLSSAASTFNMMSTDLSLLSGLGETSWITFASGFGTAATGDRIRVNYTAVDSAHANFIVQMLLEEY
jgi:hypothetical protein